MKKYIISIALILGVSSYANADIWVSNVKIDAMYSVSGGELGLNVISTAGDADAGWNEYKTCNYNTLYIAKDNEVSHILAYLAYNSKSFADISFTKTNNYCYVTMVKIKRHN